jgi:hypothetical protein
VLDLAQVASLTRAEAPGDRKILDQVYGLPSLRDLRVLVRPAGPRILAEVSLGFGEEERGIFAGVMPDTQQHPTWHLVPNGAKHWMVAPLDLETLVRKVMSFISLAFSYGTRDDPVAEMRKQIVDQFGFDLFDDLLAHVEDQVMVLHKETPDADPSLQGLCLVFKVLEMEPVSANVAKLLADSEYTSKLNPQNYRGVQVRGRRAPGRAGSLYYALTSDHLILGFGEPGLRLLHSVLDAARAETDGSPDPAVSRVLSHAPEGLNGVGLADMPTVLQGGFPYLGTFFSLVPWSPWLGPPAPDREQSKPQRLAVLLQRYGLEDLVMFTGYADSRWRLRLLW